jgi:hypothetical protein
MPHEDTAVTRTEADRRKGLLAQLQDALAARQIMSALAGRRRIVLNSARDGDGRDYPEPVRLADPELYVFAGGGVHRVTTDGEVYWITGGHPHP